MERILTKLLSGRGTTSYRSGLFLAVLYIAYQVTQIDKRVAVLEARSLPPIIQRVQR